MPVWLALVLTLAFGSAGLLLRGRSKALCLMALAAGCLCLAVALVSWYFVSMVG